MRRILLGLAASTALASPASAKRVAMMPNGPEALPGHRGCCADRHGADPKPTAIAAE